MHLMRWQNIMYARSISILGIFLSVILVASFAYAQVTPSADQLGGAGVPGPGSSVGPQAVTPQTGTVAPTGALLRDGIFGCSADKYRNPGSLFAVGGVYVPVNDAAVTLNTGYLVYKECVLDGVVSAIKNSAVADLQRQVTTALETGRDGNSQYVQNIDAELGERRIGIVVSGLSGESLNSMCAAFRRPVQTAVARGFYLSANSPESVYNCPVPTTAGDLSYERWFATSQPAGNVFGATALAGARISRQITEDERNMRDMWSWGNGLYPTLDRNQNPLNQRVITPGFVIAQSLMQMLGAGTNILVNANEIDQMNGALQAGLTATIISDTVRGLSGLTRPQNGQPSYFDRMTAEAASSVRQGAVNAALSILSAARQIEGQYRTAKEGVATALTEAILKLRDAENQCWNLIIPKVQNYASSQGATLLIATSTQFSQPIIDSQIAPLATTTINDLRASETALSLINELIVSVTNSSSATIQRAALERLDSMVANNQLHTSVDAQNATKQKDDVTTALGALLIDTVKAWSDSTDPTIGWCNVNNQDVIVRWFNEWKQ
jgi:hypothetical protein